MICLMSNFEDDKAGVAHGLLLVDDVSTEPGSSIRPTGLGSGVCRVVGFRTGLRIGKGSVCTTLPLASYQ